MSFDIIGDLGIPSETTSWLSFLEKLKESHPDGVFMIIFYLVGCETKFSIVFLLMLVAVFLFIYPKMTLISASCIMKAIYKRYSNDIICNNFKTDTLIN